MFPYFGTVYKIGRLKKREKVQWTPELDKAFRQMKAVIAQDVLMAYPDHNLPFTIYTDSSNYQLGACIIKVWLASRLLFV